MICFSCYIWNLDYVESMIRDVKKVMKDVIIWAGGPEVSYDSRETLGRLPELTGVMKGEGEKTFAKLCKVYGKRSETSELSLEQIDGITFRCPDGTICERPWRVPMDLSEVPFVYHDMKKFENKIIYYETSRGCPFSCSYCLSSIDKRLRFRSLDLVFNELQFFLDYKVPQVKFVDRTFNCKHDHAMAIWKYIQEHDNGITNFHFEVAADLLNDEEIRLIRQMRPGLIQLEIGVQSTNTDTIREIRRTMRLEEVREHVARIKEKGNIHQHLDLIAGLPYENLESFQKSFDDVYGMQPDQLQLGFLKVLKGSGMKEDADGYEIRYHEHAPYEVLTTRWLNYGEVLTLKGVEEMVEVYYNSRQFDRTIAHIMEQYDSPYRFFLELSEYYERKGLSGIGHSRIARYEILRAFLEEKKLSGPDNDQCMVLDLYARENLKSRPAFAPDLSPYKEELKNLTRDYGRQVHVEVLEKASGPEYVMFDYRKRDPLTGEAWMEVLGGTGERHDG